MAYVQFMLHYMGQKMGMLLINPFFWLMLLVVIYLYQRETYHVSGMKYNRKQVLQMACYQIISVMLGIGLSSLLAYHEIQLAADYRLLWLIPLAIGMMCIGPKWGCFSYIVAVAYFIEGIARLGGYTVLPLHYEVLILLVGVLHVAEGCLVCLQGANMPLKVPIYQRHYVSWTYVLFQMWMVPLIGCVGDRQVAFYAVLAYKDMTRQPSKQKYITGLLITVYGIIIMCIGYLTYLNIFPTGGAIVLMPLLHEFIFLLSHPKQIRCGHKKNYLTKR